MKRGRIRNKMTLIYVVLMVFSSQEASWEYSHVLGESETRRSKMQNYG